MVMQINEYKKYLEPEFIARFSNLEVTTKMILQGFMLGLHNSPLHGFSAEFLEHKQYSSGDSLKFVDWKVYGKTEKMYIKRFEDETNLYANIFLDKTASMSYKSPASNYSKLEYGRQLAAALTQLFLTQKDAVGYGSFGEKLYQYIQPRSSRQQLKIVLTEIAAGETYANSTTAEAYREISYRLQRAGVSVLISDFLEDPDKLLPAITLLKQQRQDLIVFMLADEAEYQLNLPDRLLLVDSENGKKLEVPAREIKAAYHHRYTELIKKYDNLLTEKGIFFKFITTSTPFDIPLREVLLARKRKAGR